MKNQPQEPPPTIIMYYFISSVVIKTNEDSLLQENCEGVFHCQKAERARDEHVYVRARVVKPFIDLQLIAIIDQ